MNPASSSEYTLSSTISSSDPVSWGRDWRCSTAYPSQTSYDPTSETLTPIGGSVANCMSSTYDRTAAADSFSILERTSRSMPRRAGRPDYSVSRMN